MKNKIKKYVGLSLVLVMLLGGVGFASEVDYGAQGTLDKDSFTIEEMLHYAIEDEYLAKAEYEAIIETYEVTRPFTNIIKSEQTHIDLLLPLFETYSVEIPENNVLNHVVIPTSLEEAFKVGVQAEIANIAMYEKFLEQDLPEDIQSVFQRLENASENHLRAFERGSERTSLGGNSGNNGWNSRGIGNSFGRGR